MTTTRKGKGDAPRRRALELVPPIALSEASSVELTITVPVDRRISLSELGTDSGRGRIREVVFFDTPDLTLFAHGVVLRARRTERGTEDTVVTLRTAPERLPDPFRTSPNLTFEMDVTGPSHRVSASLSGAANAPVRKVVDAERPLDRLFTKEQRRFFAAHKPAHVAWEDLLPLGPIYVVVFGSVPTHHARSVTVEQWFYPGQIPLLQLSTDAAPSEIGPIRRDTVQWLRRRGLWAAGSQEARVRAALEVCARSTSPHVDPTCSASRAL